MKRFHTAILLLGVIAGPAAKAELFNGWEKVSDADGIAVYKKEIPGNPVVSFRGKALVRSTLPKVAGILLDTRRAPEWAEDLVESRVLRWLKWPFEYVEYNHVGMPLILKDREFVSRVKVEARPELGEMEVSYLESGEASLPGTGKVRGDLTGSGFHLTALGTQGTLVDGWVHCDPKGSIPKWIVNFFQKNWPRNTLEALRRQAAKPDVKEHPYFKALYDKARKRFKAPPSLSAEG